MSVPKTLCSLTCCCIFKDILFVYQLLSEERDWFHKLVVSCYVGLRVFHCCRLTFC